MVLERIQKIANLEIDGAMKAYRLRAVAEVVEPSQSDTLPEK